MCQISRTSQVKSRTISICTNQTSTNTKFILFCGYARTSDANGRNSNERLIFQKDIKEDDLGISKVMTFHQFQGYRQSFIMSSPLRTIPSICNQRSLGYATNKGIVPTLIPAEYMLNNSDRSVLSKSYFMIKCLLSYKVRLC